MVPMLGIFMERLLISVERLLISVEQWVIFMERLLIFVERPLVIVERLLIFVGRPLAETSLSLQRWFPVASAIQAVGPVFIKRRPNADRLYLDGVALRTEKQNLFTMVCLVLAVIFFVNFILYSFVVPNILRTFAVERHLRTTVLPLSIILTNIVYN